MDRKVLFRADAFPSIGTGDLMSLINLSLYFESAGWQTYFMVKSHPAARKLIEKYSIRNVVILETDISIPSEVKAINNTIAQNSIDLIFFEITENRLSDYIGITPSVSKACISFDGSILEDMEIVIDWDVAFANYFQPENHPETIFMLGPEYVILPGIFNLEEIKKRKFKRPPAKLLVCMGGADEYNFTRKVVDKIIDMDLRMEMVIIIGAGYQYKEDLEHTLTASGGGFEIKENISTMFEEYMTCDLAIGAGGLVSSELVATGTPALLIATYQHQEARCRYFAGKGWASYLGNREDWNITHADIINAGVCDSPEIFFRTGQIVKACNALFQ